MGWLDNIGGYPLDDSAEIAAYEQAADEDCLVKIRAIGAVVPTSGVLDIECAQCPARDICEFKRR